MKTTRELWAELEKGQQEKWLKEVYGDEKVLPYQKERYQKAIRQFEELYGAGEAEIYSAPGRTEIGGNHTDHQHGEVLAASINVDAIAVVRKTGVPVMELLSEGYGKIRVELSELEKNAEEEGTTEGIIRGMAYGFRQKGYEIGGFQAYVTSDVLNGAGISSSAAFEVLIGTILSGLYNGRKVSSVEIAKIAQYAENEFFGKPCGLMDQLACSVGGLVHIDFADSENPMVEKVEADFGTYRHSLCITDTKGSHADLTEDYAQIPREMKQVAAFLGKEFLRDIEEKEFYQNIAVIQKECGDRAVLRALHFFEEDKRVEQEVNALKQGDFRKFLRTVTVSGHSSFCYLQNVYTNREVQYQGVSIGLAVSEHVLQNHGESHGVCRVHGGGFAGTIQAFVENEFVETYRQALDEVFGAGACHVWKIRPFGGIRVM